MALLAASLLIFAGLLIASLSRLGERSRHDDDLAILSEQMRAEGDLQARRARDAYAKRSEGEREERALKSLGEARASLARAEAAPVDDRKTESHDLLLADAQRRYSLYLELRRDDAEVLLERARVRELLRSFEQAASDVERALELRPDRAAELEPRILILRAQSPRPP
jgi:hypothetical protein